MRSFAKRCRNQEQLLDEQEPEQKPNLCQKWNGFGAQMRDHFWSQKWDQFWSQKRAPLAHFSIRSLSKSAQHVAKSGTKSGPVSGTKSGPIFGTKTGQFRFHWRVLGGAGGGPEGGSGRGSERSGSIFGGVKVDACWPAFLAWGREVLGPVEGATIGFGRRLGTLLAYYFCWGGSRRLRKGRIRNVVELHERW
jgi:hypothetical protein